MTAGAGGVLVVHLDRNCALFHLIMMKYRQSDVLRGEGLGTDRLFMVIDLGRPRVTSCTLGFLGVERCRCIFGPGP
jgi:hypothetical protein